jgi:DNA-binding NtrC family response regulator
MARILVVDDDQQMRSLLSEFLKMQGYDCVAAADAAQAREYLGSEKFQLVLSDFDMPGESGLELFKYIIDKYPEISGIMISGSGDLDLRQAALHLGLHAFMVKPVSLGEVEINVEKALAHH